MALTLHGGGAGTLWANSAQAVIWHDLECGRYRADLPLWVELADRAEAPRGSGPILEVGCGTGRVALELARIGHRVSALDLDGQLLGALRERAGGLPVQTVQADARDFTLEHTAHALCIVPMQTLQLLGGAPGRARFLARAHAHLRAGGLLACAIVTELDPFDCRAGDPQPTAEQVRLGELRYSSRALSVTVSGRRGIIERERRITPVGSAHAPVPPAAPAELNVVVLDLLSTRELQQEGARAGFTPAGVREVEPTADHVGSQVVLLRA